MDGTAKFIDITVIEREVTMFKGMKKIIVLGCILAIVVGVVNIFSDDKGKTAEAAGVEEMRGVWIASVYNIDFPSKTGLTPTQMKQEIDDILHNVKAMNGNAVFFQVRPVADALYPSKIFPWSAYLTGTQGVAVADDFDPLQYMIDEGKKQGIAVHAWINPYKVTRGTAAKPNHDLTALAANNPVRLYPDIVVAHPNGELYLDPGQPKSRFLVLEGIKELLLNYDLAGIHFDDYFYPDKVAQKDSNGKIVGYSDFNDEQTFIQYGQGFTNKDDWRRNNVDQLVKDTQTLIKSVKPDVQFGISPAGVWANQTTNPLGSATRGGVETYYDHYADTRKWAQEGWIDYIAPQIYWHIGFSTADYDTLARWWSDVVKDSDTKLYIGHAAYKVGDTAQNAAWQDPDELIKQVQLNRQLGNVDGSIFYGYSVIKNNTMGVRDRLSVIFAE